MAQKIFVTDAQVKAARMLVERDRALGRETDQATRLIADQGLESDPPRSDHSWQSVSRAGNSFWSALDADQRRQLISAGTWRIFPPGDVLMKEGDKGDHVIVILDGRVKVSVNRNGREHILAVRGLGELIGERAAQDVSVRSATVTALEMVWALVVPTGDFAGFIKEHPLVVNMIHDQVWKRLTEGPPVSGPGGEGWRRLLGKLARTPSAARHGAARLSPVRRETLSSENRTILLADVAGFGTRTPPDRAVIRAALHTMMNAALEGLSEIQTEERGDGFLAVLPPAVPIRKIMRHLLAELPVALGKHNRDQPDSRRFQLRLAVNAGPVSGDADGISGEAVDIVAWLLEAPDFKQTVADQNRGTSLGVIISPFVYETLVRQDPPEVASYTPAPVKVDDSDTTAWVRWISPDPVPA